MKISTFILLASSSLSFSMCGQNKDNGAHLKTNEQQVHKMTEQQATDTLRQHLEAMEPFKGALIVRLPEFDLAGYYCFSMTPKAAGNFGEVTYYVKDGEILNAGQPSHFDSIMKQLMDQGETLDVQFFAEFFLKMKVLKRGTLLETHDGHPLLESNRLPKGEFVKPTLVETEDGLNYRFWIFDTELYAPIYYDVKISSAGEVEISSNQN